MFEKIVLASDGSCGAVKAAHVVGELARALDSEVHIAACWYPPPFFADYAPPSGSCADAAITESGRTSFFDCVAGRMAEALGKMKRDPVAHRLTGSAAVEICRLAQDIGADLIALGSRGLGGFERLLLGSISEAVVHYAACSVLVAHDDRTPINRIVLAADASGYSVRAAEAAALLARMLPCSLEVLNVAASSQPFWASAQNSEQSVQQAAHEMEMVKRAIDPVFEAAGTRAEYVQKPGHPVETILRDAEQNGADLLVLGSRGLDGFEALLLGGVSDGVVRHAKRAVMVVR